MTRRLILDIGMHLGEDTEYYLARGFRVVAIEANPELVAVCKEKFRSDIQQGNLEILHGAIVEDRNQKEVRFFKNEKFSVWGTVVKDWADRNELLGSASTEITVPVVDIVSILQRYGKPYFVKIDIEGMDLVCLKKFLATDIRPDYISIESEKVEFINLLEEIETFEELGYKKFCIQQLGNIQQARIPENSKEGKYVDFRFSPDSSGPFGLDLPDNWMTREECIDAYKKTFISYRFFGDFSLIRKLPFSKYFLGVVSRYCGKPVPGWHDTHAALHL